MGPLSSTFLERARLGGDPAGDPASDPASADDLEAALASALAAARAAWPSIDVTDEAFVRYLAERLPAGGAIQALTDLHVADLFVACACVEGSAPALAAFDEAYVAGVGAALQRVPNLQAVADEVRQVMREKLFVSQTGRAPKIAEYAGRSPLRTWLRVVASRVAIDLLRGDRGQDHDDDALTSLPAAVNDPELAYIKQRYRHEVETALREAAALLSPRERNLLRHHHTDGLTLDELAALYRVHRVTIARRLGAVRDRFARETRRLLRERFGIGLDDLESLMVLVQSQLDVSIRALLGDGAD